MVLFFLRRLAQLRSKLWDALAIWLKSKHATVCGARDNMCVSECVQVGSRSSRSPTVVLWLQGITLAWMLVECSLSLYAAALARSPALLAFGSDSLIELLSAMVVVLQFLPEVPLSQERANRTAGLLLFALAGIVVTAATVAMALHVPPEISRLGVCITIAALIAMPVLAWLKKREAFRTNNPALRADAVQSANCAYLAGIALVGLVVNAAIGAAWFDSLAALVAVPLLIKEGNAAWRGESCGCC